MGFSIMVRHWIGVLIRYCKCIQLCLCVSGDKRGDWCFSSLFMLVYDLCKCDRWARFHDDIIKWKHFPRNWPFVRGIHRSSVNVPHKGQWREALMFSLTCVSINDWVNNREARDLRRNRTHYDVIVMAMTQSEFPRSISHTLQFDMCDTERLISSTAIHNNSPNLYGYNRISFADFSRHNYVIFISFPVIILCDHMLGGYFLVGNKLHNTTGSYPFIATVRTGRTS